MKRIIVDFKRMNAKVKDLFRTQYPDGFDSNDVIEFRNHHNELIKAIEVRDKEHKFLVKLSTHKNINLDEIDIKNI